MLDQYEFEQNINLLLLNFKKIQMGNNQHPILLQLTPSTMQNWVKLQDRGHYELWQNINTNVCFQAHYIDEAQTSNHDQLQKYEFRKIHNSHLVSVEYVVKNKDTFMCNQQRSTFVLVQNIVARLSSFERVFNFQEALYILSCCAAGFNTINSLFGSIQPENDLICFNEKGKVKVWLNQDLSKNEPNVIQKALNQKLMLSEDSSLAKRRNKQYVTKLIKLVQNSSINEFPLNFKEESQEVFTFFQLQNFIYYYSQNDRIKMLQYLNLQNIHYNNQNAFNRKDLLVKSNVIKPTDINLAKSREINKSNSHVEHHLDTSRVKQVFASQAHRHGEPLAFNTTTYAQLSSNKSIPVQSSQYQNIPKMQPTFIPIKRQQQRISVQVQPTYQQNQQPQQNMQYQLPLQPLSPLPPLQSIQPQLQPQQSQSSITINKRISNSNVPSINFQILSPTRVVHQSMTSSQPRIIVQSPNYVQKSEIIIQKAAPDNKKEVESRQVIANQYNNRDASLIQILQNSNHYRNNDPPITQKTFNREAPLAYSARITPVTFNKEVPPAYSPNITPIHSQKEKAIISPNTQFNARQAVKVTQVDQQQQDIGGSYPYGQQPYRQQQQEQTKQQQQRRLSQVEVYKPQKQTQEIRKEEEEVYSLEAEMLRYQAKMKKSQPQKESYLQHHYQVIQEHHIQESPQRQYQIDEWQSKLNNFTLSQSKSKLNKAQSPKKQQKVQKIQIKQVEQVQIKPKTEINLKSKHQTSYNYQPQVQYSSKVIKVTQNNNNQMANMQIDDLEAYIRIKYQIYKQQQSEKNEDLPQSKSPNTMFRSSSSNQPYREENRTITFNTNTYQSNQHQNYNDIINNNYNYKSTQYQPAQINQTTKYNKQTYISSLNYQHSYQPLTDNAFTATAKFNKENHYPLSSYDDQIPQTTSHQYHLQTNHNNNNNHQKQYTKNNHNFSYGSGYNYKDAIQEQSDEHIYSKKSYERNRDKNNKLASFDEKYSKYMGNKGQRISSGGRTSYGKADKKYDNLKSANKQYNNYENKYDADHMESKREVRKQEVSLILNNQESKISRTIKQSRYNKVVQPISNPSKSKQLSKQLSYKNLRNFLWAQ